MGPTISKNVLEFEMITRSKFIFLAMVVAALTLSGCQTKKKPDSPIVSSVTTRPMQGLPPTNQTQGVMPSYGSGFLAEKPISYRLPEKVRVIEVAGFQTPDGEVHLPTRKLVIEEEARWNMEAVRNPHRAYVNPEHIRSVPARPGIDYNFANTAVPSEIPEQIPARDLTTMDNIDITGLFRKDQEAAAIAMASSSQQAIYDEDLGWILVPVTDTLPDVRLSQ